MITLDGTSGITTPKTFAFKNRLINSQLLINQRGVSGTVTLSAGLSVDELKVLLGIA